MRALSLALSFALSFALSLIAARAYAYPHFQLTTATAQCSQCHVGPAGGGLLTEWGQDELGDTIARGGDGRFLHGALVPPGWLQLGGDVRLAALANDVGSSEGAELAVFPMQLDLTARVARGGWSAVATLGARGRVRSGSPDSSENPASEVEPASLASYLISREHYVMWRPGAQGLYLRAGRFAAPYGLRLVDHTAYVRRYLGFNLLEETYNVGGGWSSGDSELHATLFSYDPLRGAAREERGAAAMFERQWTGALIAGASARVAISDEVTRLQGGLHGKLWIEEGKLLLQGELDGVRERFEGGGDRWQLAGYLGPVFVPARGIYAGVGYQVFAQDVQVRSVTRHAGEAWVSYLPRAHFEIMATARAQWLGPAERAYLGMLQFHYSL